MEPWIIIPSPTHFRPKILKFRDLRYAPKIFLKSPPIKIGDSMETRPDLNLCLSLHVILRCGIEVACLSLSNLQIWHNHKLCYIFDQKENKLCQMNAFENVDAPGGAYSNLRSLFFVLVIAWIVLLPHAFPPIPPQNSPLSLSLLQLIHS